MPLKDYQQRVLDEVGRYLTAVVRQREAGNVRHTALDAWQQLGEDFKDHIFRFQILDEAQPLGRDWRDALTEILGADD